MRTDFFPAREADQVDWFQNFSTLTNDSPQAFGLTVEQTGPYATQLAAFMAAYARATAEMTRSTPNITTKNELRTGMIAQSRKLARIVQAAPQVTNAMRQALRLNVRDTSRTPVPAPTVSPALALAAGPGRTVVVTIRDPADRRRARPRGAASTTVLSHVGDAPPISITAWAYQASVSRRSVTLPFDAALPPGTCVWVTAFYQNARGEAGPASTAACEYLGGAGVPKGVAGATVPREEAQAYPKAA